VIFPPSLPPSTHHRKPSFDSDSWFGRFHVCIGS
jgi:hypothetical protein